MGPKSPYYAAADHGIEMTEYSCQETKPQEEGLVLNL